MTPYIIYIIATFVLSILYDGREDSRPKSFWYAVVCIYAIFIAGLRFGVGGDTLVYMDDYNYVPNTFKGIYNYIVQNIEDDSYMPLWTMLSVFCRWISDSFYVFQFVQAIIVNIIFFYIFRQYTQRIFLCTLVYGLAGYFFLFNTEIMREGIAVAAGAIAMQQYFKGEKIKYGLWTIIGILFHASAIIILVFPLIKHIHIKATSVLWGMLIAFVLWFGSDFIIEHMPASIENGSFAIAIKILKYSNLKTTLWGFLYNTLHFICFPFAVMWFGLQEEEDPVRYKNKEQITVFMLVLSILAVGLSGFSRIRNYAELYYIIALSEFIYLYIHSPKKLFLVRSCVLIGSIFFCSYFYCAYYKNSHRYHYEFYYPYTSINDPESSHAFRYEMHYESTHTEESIKNSRDF